MTVIHVTFPRPETKEDAKAFNTALDTAHKANKQLKCGSAVLTAFQHRLEKGYTRNDVHRECHAVQSRCFKEAIKGADLLMQIGMEFATTNPNLTPEMFMRRFNVYYENALREEWTVRV